MRVVDTFGAAHYIADRFGLSLGALAVHLPFYGSQRARATPALVAGHDELVSGTDISRAMYERLKLHAGSWSDHEKGFWNGE
ncbi:MAG: hypothetical protein ACXIUW_06590 [Roseinatronobacter sp.]